MFDADLDWEKTEGLAGAYFNAEADEEAVNKTAGHCEDFFKKVEAKLADGRKYSSGDNVTAYDFRLLSIYTSIVVNECLMNKSLSEKIKEVYAKMENVQRVVDNIKQLPGM